MKEVFCVLIMVLVTGLYAFVKTQRWNFPGCKLHLDKPDFAKDPNPVELPAQGHDARL